MVVTGDLTVTTILSDNIFSYCFNNPINYVDASGHWPILIILVQHIADSAAETALDMTLDAMIEGEDYSWWKSGITNSACNMIPFIGETKTAKKIGKVTSKYGENVLKAVIKHGDGFAKGARNSIDELLETVSYSSKHSKGARWVPENLTEKLAMEEVLTNPSAGKQLKMRKGMTDPRWHQDDGWVKMSKNVNGIEIHYVWNKVLNVFDDFKFK